MMLVLKYKHMYPEEKHSKAKTIWLVIILLLIGVSNTVWGLLYFKQQDLHKQTLGEVSSLTQKNSTLDKQVTDLKTRVKSSATAIDDATAWREIPELGVKFKINDNNKDLTYSYDPIEDNGAKVDTIYLSTTALTKNAPPDDSGRSPCASNYGPAGAIAKYKAGTMLPVAGTKVDDVKDAVKIGTHYLIFQKSQASCSDKTQQDQTVATKNIYDTFKSMRSIE